MNTKEMKKRYLELVNMPDDKKTPDNQEEYENLQMDLDLLGVDLEELETTEDKTS